MINAHCQQLRGRLRRRSEQYWRGRLCWATSRLSCRSRRRRRRSSNGDSLHYWWQTNRRFNEMQQEAQVKIREERRRHSLKFLLWQKEGGNGRKRLLKKMNQGEDVRGLGGDTPAAACCRPWNHCLAALLLMFCTARLPLLLLLLLVWRDTKRRVHETIAVPGHWAGRRKGQWEEETAWESILHSSVQLFSSSRPFSSDQYLCVYSLTTPPVRRIWLTLAGSNL